MTKNSLISPIKSREGKAQGNLSKKYESINIQNENLIEDNHYAKPTSRHTSIT